MVGTKGKQRYLYLSLLIAISNGVWASGSAPAKDPRSPGGEWGLPDNSEDARQGNSNSGQHFFVDYSWEGFSLSALSGYSFKPSCLKSNGLELLILDPGHDDSSASRRSDARVRGGQGGTTFLWPKIHEGQLNSAVSWMAFEMILRDPSLSSSERDELRTMIRFTRYPGEKYFGQYESKAGYYASNQGIIDSGITNRRDRANYMMQKHRHFAPSSQAPWASKLSDVSDETFLIAVHANSSEYFNEGDLTWLIRSKVTSPSYSRIQNDFRKTFSSNMLRLTDLLPSDSSEVRSLKSGLRPSFAESKISLNSHPKDLAMLSSQLGSQRTSKMLTEGFVMNGKAGNLARRQLEGEGMKIRFNYKGSRVQTYLVSDVYIQYAKSIAAGIGESFGCR